MYIISAEMLCLCLYSPASSRPPSPKSDTEYEREVNTRRMDATCQTPEEVTWLWGELPARSKSEAATPVVTDSVAATGKGKNKMLKLNNNISDLYP